MAVLPMWRHGLSDKHTINHYHNKYNSNKRNHDIKKIFHINYNFICSILICFM